MGHNAKLCCHGDGVNLYDLNRTDDAYIPFCADSKILDDLIASVHLLLDVINVGMGLLRLQKKVEKHHVSLAIRNIAA